ncbi:hypothetical protein ACFW9F_27820 [Streptomyces sp. NPDC059506]
MTAQTIPDRHRLPRQPVLHEPRPGDSDPHSDELLRWARAADARRQEVAR